MVKAAIQEKVETQIPEYLIYEVLDGKPIYYKGYEEVLNGNLTLDDIMGCSGIQSEIISYLLRILYRNVDLKEYRIYTNESGSHIRKNVNLSYDIVIYKKSILTGKEITSKYVTVPPYLVIETDLTGDIQEMTDYEYINTKIQRILDFGAEKVIWILSSTQQVIIATPQKDWAIIKWNKDIELWKEHTFNIAQHLKEEDIEL
ncbi:MAG: Uma2 family endonuclease [Saprospiraceae bacterium]